MQVAPEAQSAAASSGAAGRCRYVNSVWPGRSSATSAGCGSLTFRTSSAASQTSSARGRIRAPCAWYWASSIALPSPAPACTSTSWPCAVSSRTPAGVIATRNSSGLISVGTPTLIATPPRRRSRASQRQLPPAQREPELDAVARARQRAAGQLLDAPDPVAQGVSVAEELRRGPLPVAVVLEERVERAQQLVGVG